MCERLYDSVAGYYERIMTWRSHNLWKMFRRISFKLIWGGFSIFGLVKRFVLVRKEHVSILYRYNRGRKVWDYAPLSGIFDFKKAHMVRIFDG